MSGGADMLLDPAFWAGLWVGIVVMCIAVLAVVFLTQAEERGKAEPFPIYQPGIQEEE